MELPNLTYINELSGDNLQFKEKLIQIIKKELPMEVQAYDDAMKENDFKLAASCVHKLKHKLSILGLEKSYYIAEEFENNLKENSTNLQSDFQAILVLMQDFVDEL